MSTAAAEAAPKGLGQRVGDIVSSEMTAKEKAAALQGVATGYAKPTTYAAIAAVVMGGVAWFLIRNSDTSDSMASADSPGGAGGSFVGNMTRDAVSKGAAAADSVVTGIFTGTKELEKDSGKVQHFFHDLASDSRAGSRRYGAAGALPLDTVAGAAGVVSDTAHTFNKHLADIKSALEGGNVAKGGLAAVTLGADTTWTAVSDTWKYAGDTAKHAVEAVSNIIDPPKPLTYNWQEFVDHRIAAMVSVDGQQLSKEELSYLKGAGHPAHQQQLLDRYTTFHEKYSGGVTKDIYFTEVQKAVRDYRSKQAQAAEAKVTADIDAIADASGKAMTRWFFEGNTSHTIGVLPGMTPSQMGYTKQSYKPLSQNIFNYMDASIRGLFVEANNYEKEIADFNLFAMAQSVVATEKELDRLKKATSNPHAQAIVDDARRRFRLLVREKFKSKQYAWIDPNQWIKDAQHQILLDNQAAAKKNLSRVHFPGIN